mmetsp:Transcript_42005/g.117115  ORF Transcript_42005/g.117115 Transcript_42005/m.117115 type:complete len:246 (+) Transcript_42005:1842-2579(+)
MQRHLQVRAGLLHVSIDELVDAIDQSVVQALGVGSVAPRVLACVASRGFAGGRTSTLGRVLDELCELEETLHVFAIRGLVQNHLLAQRSGLLVNVGVPRQASRIHDGHVETLRDRVVQEDGVHGIADRVEAAEREGQIAEASAERDARARALDLCDRVDEVDAVGVVLGKASRDGEHVAVEYDVLRREVKLRTHQLVAALADAYLIFQRGCLALLIECHDNHGGTVAHAQLRLSQELLLTDLQGD